MAGVVHLFSRVETRESSIRREEEERGGVGAVAKTVDYESHQVINDSINKTNRAVVTTVTRAEG